MLAKAVPAALTVLIGAAIAPAAADAGPASREAAPCPVSAPTPYRTRGGTGRRWGNRRLYGVLPTSDGIIRARPGTRPPSLHPDGSVESKVPWFSATESGTLRVSGHRVDGSGRMLQRFPARHQRFWATGVIWPSLGCWKMNARVNDVRIAFVVSVVAAE